MLLDHSEDILIKDDNDAQGTDKSVEMDKDEHA